MSRFGRFATQTDDTRAVMLRAAWHLAVARLLLSIRGTGIIRDSMAAKDAAGGDAATARAHARTLVTVADRLPFRTTCLERSLAVHRMLRSEGIETTIRIGVRRHEDRSLAAHAWVVLHGVVLFDDDVTDWVPFDPTGAGHDNEGTRT